MTRVNLVYLSSFLALALALISTPGVIAYAQVTQVKFVTEVRAPAPGELSEILTVQTQNSAGEKTNITETADVSFQSSSSTGEFLSEAGNPASKTMSKNSSQRHFYYRDSSAGVHNLTVIVTLREAGTSWTATQEIRVGGTPPESDDDDDDDPPANTDGTTVVSAHKSPQALNQATDIKASWQLNGGRPRLTTIHTPVAFKIESTGGRNGISHRHRWSFGDGGSDQGPEVRHIYQFPGNYTVITNVVSGREESTYRTSIEVIEPKLKIVEVIGGNRPYIELSNPSSREVNLGDWRLETLDGTFTFPSDTIISAGASLKLPGAVIGLPTEGPILVYLRYPDGTPADSFGSLAVVPVIASPAVIPVPPAPVWVPPATTTFLTPDEVIPDEDIIEEIEIETEDATIIIPKADSWWSRNLQRLRRWF